MTKLSSTYPIALNFDQHPITILADEAGELWWFADEVCDALGLSHVQALSRLDDDEKGIRIADTPGGPQRKATINESGLYSLILRSRKPEAKRFKKWVTSEVLPQIRKTGSYGTPTFATREADLSAIIEQLARQSATIEQLARDVAALRTQAPALPASKLADGVHLFGSPWARTSARGQVSDLQARVRIKNGVPFEVYAGRIIPDDGYLGDVETGFAKAFPGWHLGRDWRSAGGWPGEAPPPDAGMVARARRVGVVDQPARVIDDEDGNPVAVEWKGQRSPRELKSMSAELRRLRYSAGPWKRVAGGYRAELH